MKKILIVEDEAAFQKLIGDQLKKEGYEIIRAEDGKKGLDEAFTQHPDLILLDLKLPVMDGLTVLDELRKDSWGVGAKIIILTNLEPDKEILNKVLKNKPALYLIKSNIRLSELNEKILNILL